MWEHLQKAGAQGTLGFSSHQEYLRSSNNCVPYQVSVPPGEPLTFRLSSHTIEQLFRLPSLDEGTRAAAGMLTSFDLDQSLWTL